MNLYPNSGLPLLTKWSWGSYSSFLRLSPLNYIKTSVCVCTRMRAHTHIPSTKRSIIKIIVCLLKSLCCIPDTNMTLQINYPSTLKTCWFLFSKEGLKNFSHKRNLSAVGQTPRKMRFSFSIYPWAMSVFVFWKTQINIPIGSVFWFSGVLLPQSSANGLRETSCTSSTYPQIGSNYRVTQKMPDSNQQWFFLFFVSRLHSLNWLKSCHYALKSAACFLVFHINMIAY